MRERNIIRLRLEKSLSSPNVKKTEAPEGAFFWNFCNIYLYINSLYFRMKRTTLISLIVVGVLIFGFVIVQLLSWFIYVRKNLEVEYGKDSVTSYEVAVPSMDARGDALYNNEEGSKVQKTGTVNFLVVDIDESVENLNGVNSRYEAQITNINDSGRGNDRYVQLTIKVPVKSFESYYNELREMDGEVIFANVGTNDLTERYIDITSRLENLRKVETQLVGILEGAESVQDILAVQKELNTVRGDIESYEAQKRYFDSQTDYSYITITFSIDKEGLNISDEPWKPVGEFRVALNALVSVLKGLVNIGIWVLVFSPAILIPVGIVLLLSKRKGEK